MDNQKTAPMAPAEVARRYLQPFAYDLFVDSIYVDKSNVRFLRERMTAYGNPEFRVLARGGK